MRDLHGHSADRVEGLSPLFDPVDELLRFFLKCLLTKGGTKIVIRALVSGLGRCRLLIHDHSTNQIDCHNLLSPLMVSPNPLIVFLMLRKGHVFERLSIFHYPYYILLNSRANNFAPIIVPSSMLYNHSTINVSPSAPQILTLFPLWRR